MERRSDKHGPLLDDALEHDVRSMLQGSPVESRADEGREQEGAATQVLSDDEVDARAELARFIEPSVFPADRDALLDSARGQHAPDSVLDRLARLPDGTYTHTQAVWEALGGHTERGHT
jgi:hypothetical protein